jgi:ParB/RepB/Spo0J family partition protein
MLDKPETRRPVVDIDPERIVTRGRLRKERSYNVDALATSIEAQGLLQPIIVRRADPATLKALADCDFEFILVAGRHRLLAVRKLKQATIRAEIIEADDNQALLIEVDENLVRADLTAAERALLTRRRKEVYELLHPETVHGAVGRGGKSSQDENSFVDDTAEKTGKGKSTIGHDVTLGNKIGEEMLGEIRGTSLDSGVELDALAKLSEAERRELVDRAKAGEEVTARTAQDCDDPAHDGPEQPDGEEDGGEQPKGEPEPESDDEKPEPKMFEPFFLEMRVEEIVNLTKWKFPSELPPKQVTGALKDIDKCIKALCKLRSKLTKYKSEKKSRSANKKKHK